MYVGQRTCVCSLCMNKQFKDGKAKVNPIDPVSLRVCQINAPADKHVHVVTKNLVYNY